MKDDSQKAREEEGVMRLAVEKGKKAERFLAEPYIKQAFNDIKLAYFQMWMAEKDSKKLDDLHRRVGVLAELEGFFLVTAESGKVEQARLDEFLKHDKERKKWGIKWQQ